MAAPLNLRANPDAVHVTHKNMRLFWFLAYLATALLAAAIVWIVGHRGVFLYDQSGVFDGGWRLLQGQVLYRDFYTPYGPVVFLLQAFFFRLAGVEFSSMVLAAAVVNSAAVVCVMWIVRRLFPESINRIAAIGAGIVTAVWFQAPEGTLWFQQTGFLFNLIAIALLLESDFHPHLEMYFRVGAGCSLALSVLSKQSAVVFLPIPIGIAVFQSFPDLKKISTVLLQICVGILCVSAVFAVWLWQVSSFSGFWQSVAVMSRVLAGSRYHMLDHAALDLILLKKTRQFVGAAIVALIIFAISRGAFTARNRMVASWIVFGCIVMQNLFASITNDEVFNNVGYVGLINGLAFALFSQVFRKKKSVFRLGFLLGTAFLFVLPANDGWFSSWNRLVLEIKPGAQFEPVQVKNASRLVWGEPGFEHITRKDFEGLNAWLDDNNANFFVFASSTLLYGLHQRISPQPWLYLFPDHSFRMSDISQVDSIVLDHLKNNQVRVFIFEKNQEAEHEKLLNRMPLLKTWLQTEFEKTREFGIYEVWTLR
jgi:hypothetical protein